MKDAPLPTTIPRLDERTGGIAPEANMYASSNIFIDELDTEKISITARLIVRTASRDIVARHHQQRRLRKD
jgi:hypothetical protein